MEAHEAPRRRASDVERRRWNDTTLDQLDRRLNNVEDDMTQLAEDVRADIRELRSVVNRRFNGVDGAINRRVNWPTVLAVASGIGVPIAVAFIAAPG